MNSNLDGDAGFGVDARPLFGMAPVVPWELQAQFSSLRAEALGWVPPKPLRALHFPILVASLWQRLIGAVREPVRRADTGGGIVLEIVGTARIRRHDDGTLSACVREPSADGTRLQWNDVPDGSVVLAGIPARFVWLDLIRAAATIEIVEESKRTGVACDKGQAEAYARELFEHFRRQLIHHADLRAMRRHVADALRLDDDAVRLAHRCIKLPPDHRYLMIADYNLAVRYKNELLALEREFPQIVPLYAALVDRKDFKPRPEPAQGARVFLAENGLGPRAWRLICRSNRRLFVVVRDLYAGRASDAMLDYLRVLDKLGFDRQPDTDLVWLMLSRYGHSAARRTSYLQPLAPVEQAFAHVAKVFMRMPCTQRAAERHQLETILEWLDICDIQGFDKPQRRAGWRWLVQGAHEWRALREAEIGARAAAWHMPFDKMTQGRLEVCLLASVAELWAEARAMHHCADVFADACASGTTIIASIRDRRTHRRVATARMNRNPRGWDCAQVRGFANKDPVPAAQRVVHALADRLNAVTPQPSEPADAVTLGEPERRYQPTAMPRTARHIGRLEWAWSPMHTCVVSYYLTTNRQRSLWLLWQQTYDDNWARWHRPFVCAHGPRRGSTATTAAIRLLEARWREDRDNDGCTDCFHMIDFHGLLGAGELEAIGRRVWPDSEPINEEN